MLRIVQQDNQAVVKGYFRNGKEGSAGYYAEGGESLGAWGGEGAKLLGLDGACRWKDFEALVENLDPSSLERLTPRSRSNRRVGYDFSFHVPKSLSLLAEWTLDPDLFQALKDAVRETMAELEADARTRVRLHGVSDDSRITGNLVHASFLHRTTRPLDDGTPDPHLHVHCFVFNATYDREENRWKALDASEIKRKARYYEASFHARLTWKLRELGYALERNRKGWEIKGISEELRGKFSRRTKEIEELATRLKVRDPEKLAELGAQTRNHKSKALTLDSEDLRTLWAGRMTKDERESLSAVQTSRVPRRDNGLSQEVTARSLTRAEDHHFERKATVLSWKLLETALRWGLGWVLPSHARSELQTRIGEKSILAVGEKLTSPKVLEEEIRLVSLAKSLRGIARPLLPVTDKGELSDEQLKALNGLLQSRDAVSILVGRAGTGKTTLLKVLRDALSAQGYSLEVFAPTAEASRGVLRREGFSNADTVQRLFAKEDLSPSSVVLVDEAGMLSLGNATRLLDLAAKRGMRIILVGDPAQHTSVERGGILELLTFEAGIIPSGVREIRRQKGEYQKAVSLIADGLPREALGVLDNLGWISEFENEETRVRSLAKEYAALTQAGKSVLVVSPTHQEGEAATMAIREELRESGLLKGERVFSVLREIKMTEAERKNPSSYCPGDVLVFPNGIKRTLGNDFELPKGKRWEVFRSVEIQIAAGDVVRVTRNSRATGGQELRNGAVYAVEGFTKDGELKLNNGWEVTAESFLTHGYVSTSHSSQGKTVDRVLVLQSCVSKPASSMEQAYVSISRGKEAAKIFTDFKDSLLSSIEKSEDRETATTLLAVDHARWQGMKEFLKERAITGTLPM